MSGPLLALLAALAGLAAGPRPVADTVSGPIACAELQAFARHSGPRVTRKAPDTPLVEWKEGLVRHYAIQERLAALAHELGADEDSDYLAHWENAERSILLEALRTDIEAGATVAEEDVRRYFEEHREQLARPEMITTRFILRHVGPDAGEAEWSREEELLRGARERALAGEAFGALARELSQAENAARGGAVRTSPRGGLLAAYEEAAWRLDEGEISDVVRLPDGPALILLERRLPAEPATLEGSRARIEGRLHADRLAQRKRDALVEGCGTWPLPIDPWKVAADPARAQSGLRPGDRPFDPARLGVLPDGPWWPERLANALESHCLLLVARRRGLAERPEAAASLATTRRRLLATWATDRLVRERRPEVSDDTARGVYDEHRQAFRVEETRTLEALEVPIRNGDRRAALQVAECAARGWANGDPAPADALPLQRWGPLTRPELGARVSPLVAATVFEAEPGAIEGPVVLESYDPARSRFEPRSYLTFRVVDVVPSRLTPFAEAREKIERFALRGTWSQLTAEVAAEAGRASELRLDSEALERCELTPPAKAR